MSEPGPGARRSQARTVLGSLDTALVVFGLATGVLAVGAGELVDHAERQLGAFTGMTSLLVTLTIAVVAVRFGDPLLGWLRARARLEHTRHS